MEKMDKRLTVPKWVLINGQKITQIPINLSASAEAQKFGILMKKGFIGRPQHMTVPKLTTAKYVTRIQKWQQVAHLKHSVRFVIKSFHFHEIIFIFNKFERNFFIFTKYIHLKVSKFSLLTTYKKSFNLLLNLKKVFQFLVHCGFLA